MAAGREKRAVAARLLFTKNFRQTAGKRRLAALVTVAWRRSLHWRGRRFGAAMRGFLAKGVSA
jgi:hypothetical protein